MNKSPRPSDPAPASAARARAMALEHELQVHQVELEMQNEELRRAQMDLAAARDRYADLYDFAPVGYFTLNGEGRIIEANLTGAALLGEQRASLLKHSFSRYVGAPDGDRWHRAWHEALQHDDARRIELAIKPRSGARLHAQLDCLRVAAPGAEPQLRVTLTDITERQQAEIERRIAAGTVEAREAERRRVSRELHEELGQRLSALKMELSGLRPALTAAEQQQHITAMLDDLDDAVATVRRIASELRPLMLDDLGLNAALDWLARDSTRRLGLAIALQLDDVDPPLGERASISVYRMLQEILAHIASRSRAADVSVELRQDAGELCLLVLDNDNGMPESSGPGELVAGTPGLRQHARLLGGEMIIDEMPGGGRRFMLRLPLPGAAGAGARAGLQGVP